MSRLLLVIILLHNLTYIHSEQHNYVNSRHIKRDIHPQEAPKNIEQHGDVLPVDKGAEISLQKSAPKTETPPPIKNKTTGHMLHVPRNETNQANINSDNDDSSQFNGTIKRTELESGAFIRGMFVFVALSVIFIIYVAFTTYYRRKNRRPVMVRKYGVRTRRSDLEMTPLPLDEDEDDETVFDVANVNR